MTRRSFLGTSTAVAAGFALFPGCSPSIGGPNSRFNGVQIGTISYSFRELPSSAEDILGYLVHLGINSVELMGGPIEQFAGAPQAPARPQPRNVALSEEEQATFREEMVAYSREIGAWRMSPPMEKFQALRRMYNDEGVDIRIAKLGNASWEDEQIDYAFDVARTLGAIGITMEVSDEAAARMAPFASKHRMYVGLHNHMQVGDDGFSYDRILSHSPYNAINLDVGHYVAGTNQSPIPVIQQYSDRIISMHFKDRKMNRGANVPFGQGDTPLREILQLLKQEQYPIVADIELEYPVPEGSDVLSEMEKCVAFCREALA